MGFVTALGVIPPGTRIIDLGSGGGLPGLVLGYAYPLAAITLIDRRQKRTDFLRRSVRRLGWDHVVVVTADVTELARDVAAGVEPRFDVVTARGFGPPDVTLRLATALSTDVARIVISEPPSGDRWDPALLNALGLRRTRCGLVSVFDRVG
jgi:16S rRNA (guanine527-N7)-methyltransferase